MVFIPVTIKPEQIFIRNGIESIFAELTTTNGIIVVGLNYKRSVDISTDLHFLLRWKNFLLRWNL